MVRHQWWLVVAGGSLGLLVMLGPLTAQISAAEPAQSSPASWSHQHQLIRQDASGAVADDWELTMRIRAALVADPQLAGHNLIVVVRGGLVEVDGPVPNMSFRDRVRHIVSSVPGVRQLRERLRVQAEAGVVRPIPRRLPPIDQPWPWDLLTMSHDELPSGKVLVPGKGDAAPRRPAPSPVFLHLSLMSPIPDDRSPSELDFASSPIGASQVLISLREHLRRQWRFRNLDARQVGQVLYLWGTVETSNDLQELQQLVSHLAPTLQVRLDAVRVAPPHSQSTNTTLP